MFVKHEYTPILLLLEKINEPNKAPEKLMSLRLQCKQNIIFPFVYEDSTAIKRCRYDTLENGSGSVSSSKTYKVKRYLFKLGNQPKNIK